MFRVPSPHSGALPRRAAAPGLLLSLLAVLAACEDSGVDPVGVGSVQVTPPVVTLVEGDTARLSHTVRDGRGNAVTGRVVLWTSSDTSVLSVGQDGLVRARRSGRSKVSASVEGHVGFSTIDVLAATLFPRLLITEPTSAMEGDADQVIVLKGANFAAGAKVDWNGTVYDASFVSPQQLTLQVPAAVFQSPGTANVSVLNPHPGGGVSNALSFPVARAPVAQVEITPATADLQVGQVVPLSTLVRGPAGRVLHGRAVAWSATPSGIVAVDGQGRVTGLSVGNGRVSATVEGITSSIDVRVVAVQQPVTWVIPSPSENFTVVGLHTVLSARVLGPGGTELQGRVVEWHVESPEIASVDARGVALGLKAGVTRIRATSEGVHGWGTLEVRVLPTGSLHTYELRQNGFMKPNLGDTLWTMPNGEQRQAALVLDSAQLELDFGTGRYRQTFVAAVLAGFDHVGNVVWSDAGDWSYHFSGGLVFTSSTEPGRTFRSTASGPGTITLTQGIRGRPEGHFLYLIR